MSETDGIVSSLRTPRKGIALAIVSGRCMCPVEMVTAIAMQSWPTNTNMLLLNLYGTDIERGAN